MGKSGLGTKRSRFSIKRIILADATKESTKVVYENERLNPIAEFLTFETALKKAGELNSNYVTAILRTPMRIRYKQKLWKR